VNPPRASPRQSWKLATRNGDSDVELHSLSKLSSLCSDSRDAQLGPTEFQFGEKTGASVRRSRDLSNVALRTSRELFGGWRGDNRRGDDWLGLELSQAFQLVRPAQPGERKRADRKPKVAQHEVVVAGAG
jgi:hypothetical protein